MTFSVYFIFRTLHFYIRIKILYFSTKYKILFKLGTKDKMYSYLPFDNSQYNSYDKYDNT